MLSLSRRHFLTIPGILAMTSCKKASQRPRVAAIVTTYYYWSHADVIAGRMLKGYHPNGELVEPRCDVVSMYTDQIAEKDLSRGLSAEHGFPIYPTIAGALTMDGDELAVDAVLLVGEHGDYPRNDVGQKLYPRHRLYSEIVEVFRRAGKAVPVFTDKHLSYSWEKADEMYRTSQELDFPLMAGSSIPVTGRSPRLEIPPGTKISQAVAVGYGDKDAYGFHTLEGLQCMVERRGQGETGIASVEWIEGDAVWSWRDGEGAWSAPLLEAALGVAEEAKPGLPEENVESPALFLLNYNDGLTAAAYMLEGHVDDFLFAGRIEDDERPVATRYVLGTPDRELPHFDSLVHCIEEFFVTGEPVYPVERTLLTTGALALLFESRRQGERVETPQLDIIYQTPENAYFEGR